VVAAAGLRVHVQPEDAAEEVVLEVLAVAAVVALVPVGHVAVGEAGVLVVAVAAVAEGDVEHPVRGPEGERTRVVVGVGVVELKELLLRGGVGAVGVRGGDGVLREDVGVVEGVEGLLAERRAVEDEEAAVLGVVRVEGEPDQPALVVAVLELDEAVREVEEGAPEPLALGRDDPDLAGLVGDEQPAGAVRRLREGHGACALGLRQRGGEEEGD
jgi:hypothetical protein